MESLGLNTGCWIIRPTPAQAETTVVVTGLGRSGTTMVSRVLSELGVFMGESLTTRTNEDADIKQCVKDGDEAGFERLCRRRDARYSVWGFKNPGFRDQLPAWEKHIRNPRVILLFRDILAIALRNHIAMNIGVEEALALAARSYIKALKRLEDSRSPALLLSYEKCLSDPGFAVQQIAGFCGVAPTPETMEGAKAAIRNGDERYFAEDDEAPPASPAPDGVDAQGLGQPGA